MTGGGRGANTCPTSPDMLSVKKNALQETAIRAASPRLISDLAQTISTPLKRYRSVLATRRIISN